MKWVRYSHDETERFGVLREGIISASSLSFEQVVAGAVPDEMSRIELKAVRLLAPVPRPGKIVAIGLNYMDHCREQKLDPPERPVIFCKFATSLNHPGGEIRWSKELTQKVDSEAELAVVIGKTARRVTPSKALDYVFGYTCGNDVSARDLQFSDGQWVRGKSLDTFCPLGPVLVTKDEIPNPQELNISGRLNGEYMQQSNTREMIFGVAELVAYCSQAFTFQPGDVILTGTPDGVGIFRDPPVLLQDGDIVEVEIEGIGRLTNRCRCE